MKKVLLLMFSAFIYFCPVPLHQLDSFAQTVQEGTPKRILVLYAHHNGMPWDQLFDKGLHNKLINYEGPDFDLNIEFMDLARDQSKDYVDNLYAMLKFRYGNRQPDLIISNIDQPSDFLQRLLSEYFPGANIILVSNEGVLLDIARKYPDRASVIYNKSETYLGFMQIIEDLIPGTKNIYFISGSSAIEQNDLKKARYDFQQSGGPYNFYYLSGGNVEDILKKVSHLPPDSVIFFSTYFSDSNGKIFVPRDVLKLIYKNAKAPIFGPTDTYLGHGIVGGELISAEMMGEKTGELAMRILRGESPGKIGFQKVTGAKIFDWRQLKRWNLNERPLPQGSIVKFKEYTFFEEYKWRIITWMSLLIIQMLLIVFLLVSLTKRKKAEKALSNSEKKYRRLVEGSRDAIISIDKLNMIRSCNTSASRLFGYNETEMIGHSINVLTTEEERGNQLTEINKVTGADQLSEYESMGFRRDGSTFPVKINISTLKDESDEVIGFIEFVRDISEQKKAEKDRIKLESQLNQAQKLESIGTLAGGIAHDFNNLLTAILGYTELALFDIPSGTKLEANLKKSVQASHRAKNLVNQILMFARRSDEGAKPVTITPIANEALELIRSTIPSSIEIRKKIKSDSIIIADPTKIHQILMNLCANAAYVMEEGGLIEVIISDIVSNPDSGADHTGLKPGEYVKITISDTGPGIPKENLNLIFEPYFTTKGPGSGTGLGLSVVHGIVKSYKGEVFVDSELNKGTIFTIYLPASGKVTEKDSSDQFSFPKGTESILIIDDEPDILEILSQLFAYMGYSVTSHISSIEALEIFKARPGGFDLVVTDMTMPHMSGDKLAAELMKVRPDIPIILCTGYSNKITEEKAMMIGIKAFIYKPIEQNELAKTVRRVLDENIRK
jgi:two-component system, cell cycle sensor histidine kinase and response regulator CckA